MQILLLALAVSLASAQNDLSPSEIDGNWRSMYLAADNVEKIEEGGELRNYVRQIECQDECRNISVRFYAKKNGVCQEFTVVGVRDEASGDYFTEYLGENYFSIEYNTENIIIFHSTNVDEAGTTTNVILATGKSALLKVQELQKFARVVQDYGIPKQNIRPVILTDTCPE
ncbi:female-specific lacrimal gland protein [Fukomys damarensis]|uniref:female-specific lacrimal gland protein n=1 Tax=Fukomys damarensis TaxID=885580 RepID=UPI000540038E|nr:female-specific lacrimal gland protein [Fukomys damarensis]